MQPKNPNFLMTSSAQFILRVLLKASLLFLLINLAFAALRPIPWLGTLSAYNAIFPGRERLPFGEVPDQAFNLSLYQLEAMFASHEVAVHKPANEFRIFLVGDSSIWGFLLRPDATVSSQLDKAGLSVPDGRTVRVYNLGYPTISLMKDFMILSKASEYKPDLVIWFVTLEAFPIQKQLASPIVQNNASLVRELVTTHSLNLDVDDPRLVDQNFWQQTMVGQRRALADLLRLQLYGVLWSATRIDQYYPDHFDPPQRDLQPDTAFQDLQPPRLFSEDLALDVLSAGIQSVAPTPVLVVNEPIYISDGENANIRYNFFYPRWAYDDYQTILMEMCSQQNWFCLDAWNIIPPKEFTNSAIHYSPTGATSLANHLIPVVQTILNR